MALELVRAVDSAYPGEVEELYRRGGDYLCVWTIPAELAAATENDERIVRLVASSGDAGATPAERTVAFRANAAGTIMDWTPVVCAAGDASRARVLAELDGQQDGGLAVDRVNA